MDAPEIPPEKFMFRGTAKNPRAASQSQLASVSVLNIKVYDRAIWKKLNKNNNKYRKSILSNNNLAAKVCKAPSE